MSWPTPYPISTEAEAVAWASAAAERFCAAQALPKPLSWEAWQAAQPPDYLRLPVQFLGAIQLVWLRRCGMSVAQAAHAWFAWRERPPRSWIEDLEADLREYDALLAEKEEAR